MTIWKKIKAWWDAQYPFKAYIGWNLFLIFMYIYGFLMRYPEGHFAYGSETFANFWEYESYEVFFYSNLRSLIIYFLLFFLAMSNKDKNPALAKFLFLFPWVYMAVRDIFSHSLDIYMSIL